mgnify:FL=1
METMNRQRLAQRYHRIDSGPGIRLIAGFAVLFLPAQAAESQPLTAPRSEKPAFTQRLGEKVPPDLRFRDESGRPVSIQDCLDDRPAILALVYYECPMLCTEVLNGLARGLKGVTLESGEDYRIVTVSIDPKEPPSLARKKQHSYLARAGGDVRPEHWPFLTGDEAAISAATDAVGFGYTYDPKTGQFNHPAGITILAPDGRISKYLFGVEYAPRDIQLALVEAAAGEIGSPVDQLLLLCYQYDPASGKYSPMIIRLLRVAAVATVAGLVSIGYVASRAGRRRRARLTVSHGGTNKETEFD